MPSAKYPTLDNQHSAFLKAILERDNKTSKGVFVMKKEIRRPRWGLEEITILWHVIENNKKVARKFIGTILNREVTEIKLHEASSGMDSVLSANSIALDVRFEDDNNVQHVVIRPNSGFDPGEYCRYLLGALDSDTVKTDQPGGLIDAYIILLCDEVDYLSGRHVEAEPVRIFEMVQTDNPTCCIVNAPKLNTKAQLIICDASAYAKIEKNDDLYNLFRYISTGKVNPDNSFIEGLDKAVRCANEDPKITKFLSETRPNLQIKEAQNFMVSLAGAMARILQSEFEKNNFVLSREHIDKYEKIIQELESYPKEDREVVEPEGSC